MKRLIFLLVLAILVAGGAVAATSGPSQAQIIELTIAPPDPCAEPWVGPDTSWVYYNGDWFCSGILYYYFGPAYGWAPYWAYPYTYIVRIPRFYSPVWVGWYREHPVYFERFEREYPYWRGHRVGQRPTERFYEEHHRGQGGGWHQGFKGKVAPEKGRPEGGKAGPERVAPPQKGVSGHEGRKVAPERVAPAEKQKAAPSRVAPAEKQKAVPSRVAPPESQKGPAKMAPHEGHPPAAGHAPPAEGKKAPAGAPGGGGGEEKAR